MCGQQERPDNSFTEAMILLGELDAFFIRIQCVNQMSTNGGTPHKISPAGLGNDFGYIAGSSFMNDLQPIGQT